MAYSTAAEALFFTLVAVASASPLNGTIFECSSEGRFPDPSDCSSFFTCVASSNGALDRNKGDCKGFAFHPHLRTCVNTSKVPGCSPRQPKWQMSDPSLEGACTESSFVCSDCKTVVNCIETEAYLDSTCGDGYSCSESGSAGLAGSAACLSNARADAACTCTADDLDQTKPDPNTVNGFIFCPKDGGEARVYKCPRGLLYDPEEKQCVSEDGGPFCREPGTFPNEDCSGTYTCLQTNYGLIRSTLTCEPGLMVAPNDVHCSDPCSWPKSNHECVSIGRFKSYNDCSLFIVCVETADGSGVFNRTIRQCPVNHLWDVTAAEGMGLCVDADSVPCEVLQEHSCPVDDVVCPQPSLRSQQQGAVDDTENNI